MEQQNEKKRRTRRPFSIGFKKEVVDSIIKQGVDPKSVIDPHSGRPVGRHLCMKWIAEFGPDGIREYEQYARFPQKKTIYQATPASQKPVQTSFTDMFIDRRDNSFVSDLTKRLAEMTAKFTEAQVERDFLRSTLNRKFRREVDTSSYS